jgi:methyl-accepting chemotaxis protein
MKIPLNIRTLGFTFIIIASLGILFSLSGIGITWVAKPKIQNGVLLIIDSLDNTLTTTSESIKVIDSTIETSINNLTTIENTLDDIDTTFISIAASLDSTARLVGDDLRLTIINTQVAISSAATSAELIDKTLNFVAAIPLIRANYQPTVPLQTSLEEVASSLDDTPDALESIEQGLDDTAEGLVSINTELKNLSVNIKEFKDNLTDAQTIILEYEEIIDQTKDQMLS